MHSSLLAHVGYSVDLFIEVFPFMLSACGTLTLAIAYFLYGYTAQPFLRKRGA